MSPHIAEQIVDHLSQVGGIADDLERPVGGERHRPPWSHRLGRVHCIGTQSDDVDGLHVHRSAFVETGQEQQVGHQVLHACRLVGDAVHQPL